MKQHLELGIIVAMSALMVFATTAYMTPSANAVTQRWQRWRAVLLEPAGASAAGSKGGAGGAGSNPSKPTTGSSSGSGSSSSSGSSSGSGTSSPPGQRILHLRTNHVYQVSVQETRDITQRTVIITALMEHLDALVQIHTNAQSGQPS